MRRSLISSVIFATCISLCGAAVAQDETPLATTQQQTLTPEQQAEIAAAEANVALAVTRPAWVSGPDPDYPDSERALGHHGRVMLRGLLGLDGQLRYATVETSSRAPVLDESALASLAETRYRPVQDANGNPIAAMVTLSVSFYSFTSSEGVGAAMYTCPQFVADMDWFKATWSEEDLRNHYLYLLVRGLGTIANMNAGRGVVGLESNEAYMARWNRAIETCRDHPNWRFTQAMRPEGEYIERMAARQRRR